MNYTETMNYINFCEKFGSKLGLERVLAILEILGNPQDKIRCIHVAGTNGKGSTTEMIAHALTKCGYKIGMYTSPFLEEFEERMSINESNISKEKLCEVVSETKKAAETAVKNGLDNPTQFEIITCAAFLYFYREKVDFAVIEVGLGGRFDATNVIKPILSVITSISYDHTEILGDTLSKIAFEKAGIIKEGVPVILAPQDNEAFETIKNIAKERKSTIIPLLPSCTEFIEVLNENGLIYQKIKVKTQNDCYDIKLSLVGNYQLINCACAVFALEQIDRILKQEGKSNVSKDNIIHAMETASWHGRLEIIGKAPLIVLDGAHNAGGIEKLTQSIDIYFKYKKIILILGILHDKEVEKMVSQIVSKAYRVIAVPPHSIRAEDENKLKNTIIKYNKNCEAVCDYEEALNKAEEYCEADDMLLICGSLYMIGDMRKILTK